MQQRLPSCCFSPPGRVLEQSRGESAPAADQPWRRGRRQSRSRAEALDQYGGSRVETCGVTCWTSPRRRRCPAAGGDPIFTWAYRPVRSQSGFPAAVVPGALVPDRAALFSPPEYNGTRQDHPAGQFSISEETAAQQLFWSTTSNRRGRRPSPCPGENCAWKISRKTAARRRRRIVHGRKCRTSTSEFCANAELFLAKVVVRKPPHPRLR